MRGLPRIVADTEVGKRVEVTVWRDGKAKKLNVTLGELEKAEEEGLLDENAPEQNEAPAPAPKGTKIDDLALTVAPQSDTLQEKYGYSDNDKGVVITSVDSDGASFEKGLMEGEIIAEVDQNKVQNPQDVTAAIEGAREAGKKSVLLLIKHNGDMRFVAIKLDN